MLKSKFEDLSPFFKSKKILITTHDSADIDGLASCFGLKFLIEKYFHAADVFIYFPEITKATRDFFEKIAIIFPSINFSLENEFNSFEFNVIFILDTNNLDQVRFPDNFDINNSSIPFIFIDHHLNLKEDYDNNPINIIDDRYSSTAEIIYDLSEYFKISLIIPFKHLLIAAVLTDTGYFKYGNNDTILRVSKMLNKEINFQDLLLTLKLEEAIPVKLAKLKALQRVQIIQEGIWLIGISNVGSYEASVASALLKIGFDVGIVYSEKKTSFRISTRAKKKICLETGLHLGKILKEVSDMCEGSGGGHDGAASINGKIGLKTTIDKVLEKIKQVLNK